MASDPTAVTKLYEQIPLEAMQRVSDGYMAWYVTRVTQSLDETMSSLRSELRDNDAKEASYCPTPAEQSAIERLQRSGVTGVDLLDRMVEQGEDWLILTMRRLDHFEKTGLAPKDYSTWCEHALSGAYDWIDHERINASGSGATASQPRVNAGGNAGGAGNGNGNVPDWLASRNASQRPEDGPTAPVPSVGSGPRWVDANGNGSGASTGYSGQQPAQGDDDKGGRNIFRIFSN